MLSIGFGCYQLHLRLTEFIKAILLWQSHILERNTIQIQREILTLHIGNLDQNRCGLFIRITGLVDPKINLVPLCTTIKIFTHGRLRDALGCIDDRAYPSSN